MQELLRGIEIKVNEELFLKYPESSELGKNIISGAIDLMEEIGFNDFNFKKLAVQINSTEASVYRYFENKNKLLLYLISWYWTWMEYRLVLATTNMSSPKDKLVKSVLLITQEICEDLKHSNINLRKLNNIVICESSKSFFTKEVDNENQKGAYITYKQFVERISEFVLEINPAYKYPHMLISTIIESAHHQRYFAAHLPRLTDVVDGEDSIVEFYKSLLIKTIT